MQFVARAERGHKRFPDDAPRRAPLGISMLVASAAMDPLRIAVGEYGYRVDLLVEVMRNDVVKPMTSQVDE